MTDTVIDMFEAKKKLFYKQHPERRVDEIKVRRHHIDDLVNAYMHLGKGPRFPAIVLHIMDKPFHEVVKAMDENPDVAAWLTKNMSAIRAQRMARMI